MLRPYNHARLETGEDFERHVQPSVRYNHEFT